MTNGTSGDANIVDSLQPDRYPKEDYEKSKLIGKDIAGKVIDSVKGLKWESNPTIQNIYDLFEVEVRKPSPEELKEAKKIVGDTRFEHLSIFQSASALSHAGKEDDFRRIYAREQVLLN